MRASGSCAAGTGTGLAWAHAFIENDSINREIAADRLDMALGGAILGPARPRKLNGKSKAATPLLQHTVTYHPNVLFRDHAPSPEIRDHLCAARRDAVAGTGQDGRRT